MVIGKPYALIIMESLFESPKRFTDLGKACPIEKTRANRLKELADAKLVEVTAKPIGKRNFIHYKLTEEGEDVYRKAMEMRK